MQCFRSKKTGEIAEFIVHKRIEDSKDGNQVYAPFVIDPEEWEDYEEPKEYWYVYGDDVMHDKDKNDFCANSMKAIGNCFETKEEAEKAVEKLKAWKRLKDKGFRFTGWYSSGDTTNTIRIYAEFPDSELGPIVGSDLDLLFQEVKDEKICR